MRSREDFIKLVDSKFFRHLNKDSLIPFKIKEKREEVVGNIYDDLQTNITQYKPLPPRKYVSLPKSKYVIRMVPTFELRDYCIFYYCIKVLEDFIAENRTEGTFGGFKLGGKLRTKENLEFEAAFEDSYNPNALNIYAWKKEYGEYQAKLLENALKMDQEYSLAIHFDIANFYDCIRLDLLENKIKMKMQNNKYDDELHLLMQFLKYWNIIYDHKKTVGIPQEEIGECSRILSNFYLQEYDSFLFNLCNEFDAKYLRYADDQVIFCNSEEIAKKIMYSASLQLFREGLNINTSKTRIFNNFQEFDDYYSFSIFKKLTYDNPEINSAFEMFLIKKQKNITFKESSVLKRLLNKRMDLSQLNNQNRIKLISLLWNEDFLLFAESYHFVQIYKMLKDENEQSDFLDTLETIYKKVNFESFKLQVNKFKKTLSDKQVVNKNGLVLKIKLESTSKTTKHVS